MLDARQIIIKPIISEKAFDLQSEHNKYTFKVHKTATKPQIASALEEIFGVTVTKVNTLNVTGKQRRVRYQKGKTPDWKKAIVTLTAGDSIDIYPS
ncbi:MAG: 50S ribosomal protein L23 [Actinomycetia bacterium]|nr:50S ribosomal protein L23 [Actinomycetes bacterium]